MPEALFVTYFADQAIVLPVTIGVGVAFALAGWRRGALVWTLAMGGTYGLVLALKLSFVACGHLLPVSGVRSPSGHTATAAAVYGGLLAVVARFFVGDGRWTLPCSIAVAAVIGLSRLELGAHTAPEVLIGGIIGICGAFAAGELAGAPPFALHVWRVGVLTLIALALLHGSRLPAEAEIGYLAPKLWPLSYCRR